MIFKTNSEGQRIAVVSGNPLGSYLTGFLQGKATGSKMAAGEDVTQIHEALDLLLSETDENWLETLEGSDALGKIRFAQMCKMAIIESIQSKGVDAEYDHPLSTVFELIDQIEQGKETVTGPAGTIAIGTKTNKHNAAVGAVIADSVRNITVTVE